MNEKSKQSGKKLAQNWEEYADGRILSGTQAFELGFVDDTGTFQDAVIRARLMAGIRNADLLKYQQRYELGDIFRILGKSEAPVVKVDFGMEPPKLQAGRLYFLSPTFLH